MDDFADRTINELMESYPLFLEALKDEYDILLNMLNIIFSSCSLIQQMCCYNHEIPYLAFDCFFEYQIYKIMEKYTYYKKIQTQLYIIEYINERKIVGDLKLKNVIDRNSLGPDIFKRLYIQYSRYNNEIDIFFDSKYYTIIVEDKYKQDMLNLLETIE